MLHDVVMVAGYFLVTRREFNLTSIAVLLTIIGYSINDTIVVFDRIREELKLNPTGTLREIINRSLNLTLSRTIITGGTTLLTSVTLLLTTSGEVNDIAFTLLIGVLTGTFSSLFIATPVFYWWHKGDRKHVEAHHDVAPKYEWQGTSKAAE
jgi:SecD/SecF fusion protein